MAGARLIGLDWGGSTLRAFLFGTGGTILQERSQPWGVMRLPEGGFARAIEGIAGAWRSGAPEIPTIACGMVGSTQGVREVPYVSCPAGSEALVAGIARVNAKENWPLHIVPGVRKEGNRPDVIRGEETQVVGVLSGSPEIAKGTRLVMPGTHSKWLRVRDGRIDDFQTFMTGELFAVLSEHSILGRPARSVSADRKPAADAFDRGVRAVRERETESVTAMLFSVRALVLTGALGDSDSLDYLSGLLVGDEVRSGLAIAVAGGEAASGGISLVGDPTLCERYRRALAIFGVANARIIENAASRGLWEIALRAGLCVDA